MDNRTIEEVKKNEDKLIAESTEFENKVYQLQDNWYELEEFLETQWKETQDIWYLKILNKMQEIKEGKND